MNSSAALFYDAHHLAPCPSISPLSHGLQDRSDSLLLESTFARDSSDCVDYDVFRLCWDRAWFGCQRQEITRQKTARPRTQRQAKPSCYYSFSANGATAHEEKLVVGFESGPAEPVEERFTLPHVRALALAPGHNGFAFPSMHTLASSDKSRAPEYTPFDLPGLAVNCATTQAPAASPAPKNSEVCNQVQNVPLKQTPSELPAPAKVEQQVGNGHVAGADLKPSSVAKQEENAVPDAFHVKNQHLPQVAPGTNGGAPAAAVTARNVKFATSTLTAKLNEQAQANANSPQVVRVPSSSDDDEERAAAWKWRFTRRWKAEQCRTFNPDDKASPSTDHVEDALLYLHACGEGGINVDIPRTLSEDGHVTNSQGTLDTSSFLGAESLVEDSLQTSALRSSSIGTTATKDVASVTKRAQKLLQQQQHIEKEANERWNKSFCSAPWLGSYLDTIEIDDWGKFRFVLLKIKGQSDKEKILIRGRNYQSEGKMVEDMNCKITQLCQTYNLPLEPLHLMGGGIMEWRRDRDRHLHIHSGFVNTMGQRGTCVGELMSLAAVLTKQYFPIHYKVTTD